MLDKVEAVEAVVQKVVTNGKRGPFLVATAKGIVGSVTCSLEPTSWQETSWPEPGEVVLLEQLRKKRAGWRAKKGRFFQPSDEQSAIRKEQTMEAMEVRQFIIGLYSENWPITPEDDKVWQDWLDATDEYRHREKVIGLLTLPVREGLKARAVTSLLVPDRESNPFYWKGELPVMNGVLFLTEKFPNLSPVLHGYSSYLVCKLGEYVAGRLAVVDREDRDLWRYKVQLLGYNHLKLELLAILPSEMHDVATHVFESFSIIDPVPFSCDWTASTRRDISGLNPFAELLEREDISKEWKLLADANARQLVIAELLGKEPRVSWEGFCSDYMSYKRPEQNLEMLAAELSVAVLELVDSGTSCEIGPGRLATILNLLSGDKYQALRHRLARFAVFEGIAFCHYDIEAMSAVEMMLAEFGAEDPELAQRLQPLRDKAEAEEQKKVLAAQRRREESTKAKAAERALLERMM